MRRRLTFIAIVTASVLAPVAPALASNTFMT
jgi:hypothetical protein